MCFPPMSLPERKRDMAYCGTPVSSERAVCVFLVSLRYSRSLVRNDVAFSIYAFYAYAQFVVNVFMRTSRLNF